MKKRILFTMPSMFMGGAERSLLGLLDAIDYNKYDVELFLYRHEGDRKSTRLNSSHHRIGVCGLWL